MTDQGLIYERRGLCDSEVSAVPSGTAYQWDGMGEDPNRPLFLCLPCAGEYNDLMDERWTDFCCVSIARYRCQGGMRR